MIVPIFPELVFKWGRQTVEFIAHQCWRKGHRRMQEGWAAVLTRMARARVQCS